MIDFASEVEHRLQKDLNKLPETTTIAVVKGGCQLLMGKRRDNGKYTMPGGGVNPGEAPLAGALRELDEEAAIRAGGLQYLGAQAVAGRSGRSICVYCYRLDVLHIHANTSKDPDNEIEVWEWIDISLGLPDDVRRNLHSPKNVLLMKLGLL